MNEQYAKHLMEQRKGESPIQLWLEFITMQLLFGLALMVGVGIVLGLYNWLAS